MGALGDPGAGRVTVSLHIPSLITGIYGASLAWFSTIASSPGEVVAMVVFGGMLVAALWAVDHRLR